MAAARAGDVPARRALTAHPGPLTALMSLAGPGQAVLNASSDAQQRQSLVRQER